MGLTLTTLIKLIGPKATDFGEMT